MLYIHIFFAISPFFTLTIPAFLDVVQAPVDYWKCVIPFAGMCQTPQLDSGAKMIKEKFKLEMCSDHIQQIARLKKYSALCSSSKDYCNKLLPCPFKNTDFISFTAWLPDFLQRCVVLPLCNEIGEEAMC